MGEAEETYVVDIDGRRCEERGPNPKSEILVVVEF
jgi:hypothetical protein